MNFFKKSLSAIAMACALTSANAMCDANIFTINGIGVSEDEARKNFKSFKDFVGPINSACYAGYLYNNTSGLAIDALETYITKYPNGGWLDSFIQDITKNSINGQLLAINWFFIKAIINQQVDQNVKDMMEVLRPYLNANKGVVLAPHSEGNLFALEVRRRFIEQGYKEGLIRIVHIASPVEIEQTMPHEDYLLLTNDLVITGLPRVNLANANADLSGSFTGHGLRSDYLRDATIHYYNKKYPCNKNDFMTIKEYLQKIVSNATGKVIAATRNAPWVELVVRIICDDETPPNWYK